MAYKSQRHPTRALASIERQLRETAVHQKAERARAGQRVKLTRERRSSLKVVKERRRGVAATLAESLI